MTELKYDTNTGILPTDQPTQDGFVFVVIPGFELVNERNKLQMMGTYLPSASFYFSNPELNTIAHLLTLSADYATSDRTSLSLDESFNYSGESLETTHIGLQNQRGTIVANTLSFSMGHALTQKTGVSLSASDHVLEFENPLSVDSRNDTVSLGLTYQVTPDSQLNGSYNFSYVSFDHQDGASSSQNTHSVSAGFNKNFRENLQLSLNAGAVYANADGLGDGVYDWVATGEISKHFQQSSGSFGYTRAVTNSTGLTSQLTLSDSYSIGYSYALMSNVSLSLTGNHTRNHSQPDNTLDIKSYFAGLSVDWRLYSWLSLGARASHFKQDALGPLGDDIERNHLSINVNITTLERRF